jgi:hypothetical protein
MMAFTSGQCIEDQYGNRYTLNIDQARQYITGTVISGPFGGGPWILTGSYVQGGPTDSWIYELTVTNVNGTSQPNYVPVFKIRGVDPRGAWYYDGSVLPQTQGINPFTFMPCTAQPVIAEAAQKQPTEGQPQGMRIS